jgi:2-iminobutanoate/2-iminopropanoate deaminase
MKTVIQTDNAPRPVARYSQGIRVGNTLYVQGMTALDPKTNTILSGDVRKQSEQVFQSIGAILKEAGMGFENVVRVAAFLSDIADYPAFNEVYNRHFDTKIPPVRTTVQAGLPLGAKVEVEVIAAAE